MKDLDRKRLWGRAGCRCAICNLELTEDSGVEAILGDEAHIRARQPGGPRYDTEYPADLVDSYKNRILLCKVHHKLVDDNEEVFPAEALEEIKRRHERRVKRLLGRSATGWTEPPDVRLLRNGTELAGLAAGALAYALGNDHPRSTDDGALIGAFLQSFQDWGDLLPDVGAAATVQAAMDLDQQLNELRAAGYDVVGGSGLCLLAPDLEVPAALVRVVNAGDR